MKKILFLFFFTTLFLNQASAQDKLIGESLYRYWGFKVYVARVYAENPATDVQATLGTVPVKLTLTYSRDITKKDFIESGEYFIKENPEVSFEKIAPYLSKMNALYDNVKEGDTYSLVFIPKKGLSLYLNDSFKGSVDNDEFAKAYLGIWLSKTSISESFTERLVRGGRV